MSELPPIEGVLGLEEAAARLGVEVAEVRRRIAEGSLRALRLGEQWVTSEAEVTRHLREGPGGRSRRARLGHRGRQYPDPPPTLNLVAATRPRRPPETRTQMRRRKRKAAQARRRAQIIAAVDALARAFAALRHRPRPRRRLGPPPDDGRPALWFDRRLGVAQVARRLRIDVAEAEELLRSGRLPASRLGREWYTTEKAVRLYCRARRRAAPGEVVTVATSRRRRHRSRPRLPRAQTSPPTEPEGETHRGTPPGDTEAA